MNGQGRVQVWELFCLTNPKNERFFKSFTPKFVPDSTNSQAEKGAWL